MAIEQTHAAGGAPGNTGTFRHDHFGQSQATGGDASCVFFRAGKFKVAKALSILDGLDFTSLANFSFGKLTESHETIRKQKSRKFKVLFILFI